MPWLYSVPPSKNLSMDDNIKNKTTKTQTPLITTPAMTTDTAAPSAINLNLGGDDCSTPTLDRVSDSINSQSRELLNLLRESASLHLSRESSPISNWEDIPLSDDEMDTTVIPSQKDKEMSPSAASGSTKPDGKGVTPSGDVTSVATDRPALPRQDALVDEAMDEENGNSLTSPSIKSSKARERKDKHGYKRAVNYCSRFVDKSPGEVSTAEFREIRLKLRFLRRIERKYPHFEKLPLPIDRIPRPDPEVGASPTTGLTSPEPATVQKPVVPVCSDPLRTPNVSAVGEDTRTTLAPPTRSSKSEKRIGNSREELPHQPSATVTTPPVNATRAAGEDIGGKCSKVADLRKPVEQASAVSVTRNKSSTSGNNKTGPKGNIGSAGGRTIDGTDGPSTSKLASGQKTTSSLPPGMKRVRSSEDPHPDAKRLGGRQSDNRPASYAKMAARQTVKGAQPGRACKGSPGQKLPKPAGEKPYEPHRPARMTAPDDLLVAIIDRTDPEGRISDDHWLLVEGLLRNVITSDDVDERKTGFGRASVYKGVKVINCKDEESRDFLTQTVNNSGALWDGCRLAAIPIAEIPSRVAATTWVPPPASDVAQVLKLIRKQNRPIQTDSWKLVRSYPEGEGTVMKFTMDSSSAEFIKNSKGELDFGLGWLRFRFSQPQ
ncbi:uncharacterized protein [Musca autumnalis]|uniref:uncharacterized protein n=1 Tax=Musca autumnalis TaxID=221902 RepID=UPI003CEBE26D